VTGTFHSFPDADVVDVPVIAAGGIADARGVIAALALGAEAVQMGQPFSRVKNRAQQDSSRSLMQRRLNSPG